MSETNHASRSWDLRQKMRAATRNQMATNSNSKLIEYVA